MGCPFELTGAHRKAAAAEPRELLRAASPPPDIDWSAYADEEIEIVDVTPDNFGRIAAQRHDVPDAHVPVFARNVVDLATTCAYAGQVRRRRQRGFPEYARHRVMRAFTG